MIATRYRSHTVVNLINKYHGLRLRFTAERAHPLHNAFGIISRLYRHAPVAPFMRIACGIFIVNLSTFQAIICFFYNYFVPSRFSAGKIDIFKQIAILKGSKADFDNTVAHVYSCQFFTTEKHVFFNACHTVGNRYIRKTCAAPERTISDTFNTVRYYHTYQTCTITKCIVSYTCHTVRNSYTCKSCASVERFFSDSRYTLRNRYVFKVAATVKGIILNTCNTIGNYISISSVASGISNYCGFILVKQHSVLARIVFIVLSYQNAHQTAALMKRKVPNSFNTVRNRYARKACFTEGMDANFYNAVRNCYTCKTCTAGESRTFDACHTVRNCYTCKTCTAVENRISDACHTVRNCYTCETCTVESIFSDACHTVRNCYTCKAYTMREHPASKNFHTVGDCYACKTCTVGESIISDVRHTIRNRYTRKTRTA